MSVFEAAEGSLISLWQISQGWIVWQHRTRIQVTLVHPTLMQRGVQATLESLSHTRFSTEADPDQQMYTLPHFALNDVHLGERDQCRPIAYELEINHRREMQRSSGVLTCTGTGSSAWMYNAAALRPDQVQAVLQAASISGACSSSSPMSEEDIKDFTNRLNHQNLFHWSSPQMMVCSLSLSLVTHSLCLSVLCKRADQRLNAASPSRCHGSCHHPTFWL